MKHTYWKVVCRYGHVGRGREVSVARYLECDVTTTCFGVYVLAKDMPGVKNNGVHEVRRITRDEWLIGKEQEAQDYYLKRLKTHKLRSA